MSKHKLPCGVCSVSYFDEDCPEHGEAPASAGGPREAKGNWCCQYGLYGDGHVCAKQPASAVPFGIGGVGMPVALQDPSVKPKQPAPAAREWILVEDGTGDLVAISPEFTRRYDGVHVIEFSAYEALKAELAEAIADRDVTEDIAAKAERERDQLKAELDKLRELWGPAGIKHMGDVLTERDQLKAELAEARAVATDIEKAWVDNSYWKEQYEGERMLRKAIMRERDAAIKRAEAAERSLECYEPKPEPPMTPEEEAAFDAHLKAQCETPEFKAAMDRLTETLKRKQNAKQALDEWREQAELLAYTLKNLSSVKCRYCSDCAVCGSNHAAAAAMTLGMYESWKAGQK